MSTPQLLKANDPLEASLDNNGVLTLWINTPQASVNVFSRRLANRIHEVFDQIDKTRTKLIVFRSKKPYSFLNGAELILTQSIKSMADVAALTQNTQQAYEKVAFSPVPTVAAIEGNCFGCGVEFTLCCDYRFASTSYDTRFYMTELRDYLLLPLFGSLQKLPKLVGFKNSCELLVKGAYWSSHRAYVGGLVDRVLSHESFESELNTAIEQIIAKGPKKRNLSLTNHDQQQQQQQQQQQRKPFNTLPLQQLTSSPAKTTASDLSNKHEPPIENTRRQIQDWIQTLPPEQHALHEKCLEILIESATGKTNAEASEGLLTTLSTEGSRKATSFFFTRTMARVASIGTSAVAPEETLTLHIPNTARDTPWAKLLVDRPIKHLNISFQNDSKLTQSLESNQMIVTRSSVSTAQASTSIICQIVWGTSSYQKSEPSKNIVLYFCGQQNIDYVEAILPEPFSRSSEKDTLSLTLQTLFLCLHQLGWQTLLSEQRSALYPYISAFRNQLNALAGLGRIGELDIQLREYGFVAPSRSIYYDLFSKKIHEPADVGSRLRTSTQGHQAQSSESPDSPISGDSGGPTRFGNQTLLEQFLSPFWRQGQQDLKSGRIKNLAVLDLLMQSVFGYPLSKGRFSQSTLSLHSLTYEPHEQQDPIEVVKSNSLKPVA